jgi:hypothetical protein
MKQVSITFDAPDYIKNNVEAFAVALGLTRVRNGIEQANVSIIVRMLLEMALSDQEAFVSWGEKTSEAGRLERFTIQATDEVVKELEVCAKACNMLRRDEGQLVPNLTQVIVALLEYAVNNPDLLVEWFRMCVEEGLK